MPGGRKYTDEELKEILHRALARQAAQQEGVSHDDLVAAAGAVGIGSRDVEAAIADLGKEKSRTDPSSELAEYRAHKKRKLLKHVGVFALVNAFLVAINLLSGGPLWFFWPLLGWGLGVALQALPVLFPTLDDPGKLELWKKRKARRAAKQRDRERKEQSRREREQRRRRTSEQAEEFGRAVEEGVGHFIGALGKRIERAVDEHEGRSKPDVEGVRVEPDRVRVAVDDEDVAIERPRTGGEKIER